VVFFFFTSAAMLAANPNSIIETVAARQAAGFIAEPDYPLMNEAAGNQ
jgi:hypothetical protein